MKKNIVKRAAKIYAANIVRNSLCTGAMFFSKTPEADLEYFQKTIDEIADKLSTEQATTLEDCFKIALENQ